MALVHRAEIRPTKIELLAGWLPRCRWYQGPVPDGLCRVAAYRFDDPAGAVGIETLLIRADDGPTYQVPLTYRGAPLAGAEDWLVGTMAHSVLGRRWVYDACGDPVYAAVLAQAIFNQAAQAEEFMEVDGSWERREPGMTVTGSGAAPGDELPVIEAVRRVIADDPTRIQTDSVQLTVLRRLGDGERRDGPTLLGRWAGQAGPSLLAYASSVAP